MDRVDDLTGLDADALAAQREEATAEFERLTDIDPGDLTDENVTEMEALAEYVADIDAETERREGEQSQRAERAAAAAARIAPAEDEQQEQGEDQVEDEQDEEQDGDEGVDQNEGPEAVAASGGQGRPSRLVPRGNRRADPVPAYTNTGLTITAAADVSGFATGQDLDDLAHVARAFAARGKALPTRRLGGRDGMRQRYGVAQLTRQYDGLVDTNPDFNPISLAAEAARESRLPGGSLAAAGGWCAPSETLYGFCDNATLAGLVSLPEVGVTRGGIRWTPGPDYATVYNNCGFSQTEAQAIAGEEKNCCEVNCPDWQEVRLDVIGYCVKAPILTQAAYPELIQDWLSKTMVAAQHQKNAKILAKMEDELRGPTAFADLGSTAFTTLTALEIAAEGLRYAYRMDPNATMEVTAPAWLQVALRADLQNRIGQDTPVTNAQIQEHFTARNLSPQWVYDWQDLTLPSDTDGTVTGCLTDLPETARVMIYPAGTFTLGTADVISLDAIYDSTDLVSNVYTAAFAEDGWLLLRQCFDGCTLELPVCTSGQVGAAAYTGCATGTAPAPAGL